MGREEWEKKVFLVVGASSGIGIALCRMLLSNGARVIAFSRRREPLSALIAEYSESLEHMSVDLSEVGAGAVVSKHVGDRRLAGFVYCAGKLAIAPVKFFKHDDFTALMRINCEAFLELSQALLRKSQIEKGASIIAISSIMEDHSVPGNALYSASKAALSAAVKVMALELAREKIRVNTVNPGALESGMTNEVNKVLSSEAASKHAADYPLGAGTSADVANLVMFLLSTASTWITGTSAVVDGGFSCR